MTKQELSINTYKQIIIDSFPTCYYINVNGDIVSTRINYAGQLSTYLNNKGYRCVGLTISGKKAGFLLHRLLALTFIENPNKYPVVNHKNGNPSDNRLDNLEWCTQSYNCKHSFKIGKSYITQKQRLRISKLMKDKKGRDCRFSKKVIDTSSGVIYDSQTEAAKCLGIKRSTLCAMLIGQNKNKTNIIRYEKD